MPHLEESVMLNGPTQLALTFCDHLDPRVRRIRREAEITDTVGQLIAKLEQCFSIPVTLVGLRSARRHDSAEQAK